MTRLGVLVLVGMLLAIGLLGCSNSDSGPTAETTPATLGLSNAPSPTAQATATSTPKPSGELVALWIPSIPMRAEIERLGIDSSNTLETPKDPEKVGWYTPYTQPGTLGNSVWVGYSGTTFRYLKDVAVDSDVFVETKSGGSLHYKVLAKREYEANAIPMGRIITAPERPAANEWMSVITSGRLDEQGNHLSYWVVVAERKN